MAPTTSYPGVYVEEIPTGVHTIAGVPTGIAAFVGRATRGPTDEPVSIGSWGEYQRRFGGLAADCATGYAVRDFYANGGTRAVVVRVAPADAVAATIHLELRSGNHAVGVVLEAVSTGTWGNDLRATAEPLDRVAPLDAQAFSLTIELAVGPTAADVTRERFLDVSLRRGHSRYLPNVLAAESALVRVHGAPRSHPRGTAATSGRGAGGSDGRPLTAEDVKGSARRKSGLQALDRADRFDLLCIPPLVRGNATPVSVYHAALALCVQRRAFLILDPDPSWGTTADEAVTRALRGRDQLDPGGTAARNAALYFPCVRQRDPLGGGDDVFVPCGIVAGIMARIDATRGVWKAPAGYQASLVGTLGLQVDLDDRENERLNAAGVNCLRVFPSHGNVIWGARTLQGADPQADEFEYIPIRRLALFVEESLWRGTQWAAFEPNGEALWSQIRRAVGTFMDGLFRQGAFQGRSPIEAYFVKCDAETTTPSDIYAGFVNVLVGFAPQRPAEFLVIKIRQRAAPA